MSKKLPTAVIIIIALAAALAVIFLAGRYGWKIFGFDACSGAVIESVEISDGQVEINGSCPGLVPKGFIGFVSKEEGDKLFVGFRFSAVFGFFETGDFDITIPVKGEIGEVYVKTAGDEYLVDPELYK